jgi:hypothetical protein
MTSAIARAKFIADDLGRAEAISAVIGSLDSAGQNFCDGDKKSGTPYMPAISLHTKIAQMAAISHASISLEGRRW